MKLLFCPICSDVRKLVKLPDATNCKCGKSFGWYLEDGWNAVISGAGMAIGLDNNSVKYALQERQKGYGKSVYLNAWLMATDHKTIEYGPREVDSDEG